MNRLVIHLMLVLPAGVCAGGPLADYPTRKPGLWEVTRTSDAAGTPPSKAVQCVDAATDRMLLEVGQNMAQQMCQTVAARREGDKFTLEQTCQLGPKQKTTARTVMSGDYQRAYRTEVQSQFNPPIGNIKQSTSIEQARWLGPCKAGQRPGDVAYEDGIKLNVADLMKAMSASQKSK